MSEGRTWELFNVPDRAIGTMVFSLLTGSLAPHLRGHCPICTVKLAPENLTDNRAFGYHWTMCALGTEPSS